MREARALRRAAWRELWPAAMLAIGCAIVLAYASAVDNRPAPIWIGLWLAPAALLCGIACGRGSSRMLAFLLARPVRRERVLESRLAIACGSMAVAWTIVAVAVFARQPHAGAWVDAAVMMALLVLAVVCGALGSTATDREPLAFGIGVLVYASILAVPLIGVEALDITLARTVIAFPTGVALSLAVCLIGIGRAVRRAWRVALPLRDPASMRVLATGCAGSWVIGEAIIVTLVWCSVSPTAAAPMIVLGAGERGVVVASGSPGGLDGSMAPRIDSIQRHIQNEVPVIELAVPRPDLFDRRAEATSVTRALANDHVVVVELTGVDGSCHIRIRGSIDTRHNLCGRMSLSPSGRSLAIASKDELVALDLVKNEIVMQLDVPRERDILGWRGELPVSWERRGHSGGRTDDIFVGDTKVANIPAVRVNLSPDGHRLAAVVPRPAAAFGREGFGMARVVVFALADGSSVELVDERQLVDIAGWLDDEHVAVVTYEGKTGIPTFSIRAGSTAETIAEMTISSGAVTAIDGPVHGPWIVTRAGLIVEAIDPASALLWSERVARFERDETGVRRWAITDGEVVGIDPNGRWWRHPLPWEVTP